MENDKYYEIVRLAHYWLRLGGPKLSQRDLYNGWQLFFPNGADVIQHDHSYGHDEGCVEFAGLTIEDLNYCAIPLEEAKEIIETFFDELNETY